MHSEKSQKLETCKGLTLATYAKRRVKSFQRLIRFNFQSCNPFPPCHINSATWHRESCATHSFPELHRGSVNYH